MSNITNIKKERNKFPKKLQNKNEQLKNEEVKEKEKEKINENEDEETVFITSSINEVFATSEVIQYFTNKLNKSIELIISFPLKHEIQLSKFLISIGNKTIVSKVLEKEKAEEKYSDAIASGNTGFLSTFDESYSNYTINIGNILPQEKVKLTSIFNQMITSDDMSYEFSFMEHYPCFVYDRKKIKSKKIKGIFILETKSKITRLISPFMDETSQKSTSFDVIFSNDYNKATIHFNKEIEIEEEIAPKRIKRRPFNQNRPLPPALIRGRRAYMIGIQPQNFINNTVANTNNINQNVINNNNGFFPGLKNRFTSLNYFCFLFRTEKMNIPMLYSQYDPETKETAFCLNYIYSSKNLKKIPIPEKPDQDNKVSYYSKYQENLMNETPGLFIFLIDQSGSMRGNSINLVKKALTLFIQSLPAKSFFQLIGFGSNFHKYNNTPVEYNKENVKNILSTINALQANMGGTNISSPLKDIFENKSNIYNEIPLSKNIFLLTDGQVNNRESCINLISINSDRFRIHSIGIGNDFDKILIERSGKLGKGTSSFVEDINKINEVVINTLNRCLRPYLIDLKFNFNDNSLIKNPIIINEPINNFTYQDEIINYSFILDNIKKKNIDLSNPIQVQIKAKDPFNEINETINLSFPENIIKLSNGDNLARIIVGMGFKYNKILLDSNENEIKFAKKYQLLSKNTALFGEILKDENSLQNELIKVELNKKNLKKNNNNTKVKGGGISMASSRGKISYKRGEIASNRIMLSAKLKKKNNLCPQKNINSFNLSKKTFNKFENSFQKKSSFAQREDGSIGIVDEFSDMLLTQDIIEGSWNENSETKKLINKIKKVKFDKIVQSIKNKNINQDINKIIYTILVIYYIKKERSHNINEYRLVINKGIKFLLSKGINYDEEIKSLNI